MKQTVVLFDPRIIDPETISRLFGDGTAIPIIGGDFENAIKVFVDPEMTELKIVKV